MQRPRARTGRPISRRRFVRIAVRAAGFALGAQGLWPLSTLQAQTRARRRQHAVGRLHSSRILGMGTGTDLRIGNAARYPFGADMGIMKGTYVGEDGKRHTGAFGFL